MLRSGEGPTRSTSKVYFLISLLFWKKKKKERKEKVRKEKHFRVFQDWRHEREEDLQCLHNQNLKRNIMALLLPKIVLVFLSERE